MQKINCSMQQFIADQLKSLPEVCNLIAKEIGDLTNPNTWILKFCTQKPIRYNDFFDKEKLFSERVASFNFFNPSIRSVEHPLDGTILHCFSDTRNLCRIDIYTDSTKENVIIWRFYHICGGRSDFDNLIYQSVIANVNGDERISCDLRANGWKYSKEEDWILEDRCLCLNGTIEGADEILFQKIESELEVVTSIYWTELKSKSELFGCWFRIVRLKEHKDAMFVIFTDPTDTKIVGWFYHIDLCSRHNSGYIISQ